MAEEGQPILSDSVTVTLVGLVISALAALGHLYTMVFSLRKEVREEMSQQAADFNRKMDALLAMQQTDRLLREETRVVTERELGRTVKREDLRTEIDRLIAVIDKREQQRHMRT